MPVLIEHFRKHDRNRPSPSSHELLTESAARLREVWWKHASPSPWLDIGIFRIGDPRLPEHTIEQQSIKYDEWIGAMRKRHASTASLEAERAMVLGYVHSRKFKPHFRILELHIPPRQDVRSIARDLEGSMAQLAGWIETYNFYYPDIPVALLMGRTALPIRKRAPAYGFERFITDAAPWESARRDLIEHLLQNPHLDAETLTSHPITVTLTNRKHFSNHHGIRRTGDTVSLRDGHSITLPHAGNGRSLWLRQYGEPSAISEHDAQVVRGIVQLIAALYAEDRNDVRIRVPDPRSYAPYLDHARRSDGIWKLHQRLGVPIRSYGMPPAQIIDAVVSPVYDRPEHRNGNR